MISLSREASWPRRWFARRRRKSAKDTREATPKTTLVLVAGGAGPNGFAWQTYNDAHLGPIRVPAKWQKFCSEQGVSFMDPGSECALFIRRYDAVTPPHDDLAGLFSCCRLDTQARRIRGCQYGRLGSTLVARTVSNIGAQSTDYTRDYLLFLPTGAVLVGAQAPVAESYLLGLVVDAVVGSATLPGLSLRPATTT